MGRRLTDITPLLLRKLEKLGSQTDGGPFVILFYMDGEAVPPIPSGAGAVVVVKVVQVPSGSLSQGLPTAPP